MSSPRSGKCLRMFPHAAIERSMAINATFAETSESLGKSSNNFFEEFFIHSIRWSEMFSSR